MDNPSKDPTLELLQLATALRNKAMGLAAVADLPPRQFRRASWRIPQAHHCEATTKGGEGLQVLRRLTLRRQSALLSKKAEVIDAALDRAARGFGLPSDWVDLLTECRALLE